MDNYVSLHERGVAILDFLEKKVEQVQLPKLMKSDVEMHNAKSYIGTRVFIASSTTMLNP